MKLRIRPLVALLALAAGAAAFAQRAGNGEGEVRKLDAGQHKLTLKHDGVKPLDMPPMTMSFHVKDAAMLKGLTVGDHVSFTVEKLDGTYTVTELKKRP